ncbi:hypothetical protein GJAV_G00195130 [Gymnothorax javanicus]|nr:hypothetical protein GJAV_G00195130 [Gymnothorax javanicus]
MEEEKVSEVLSRLSLPEQRGDPEGDAGGDFAAPADVTEQGEDSFFDCRETLEEATGSHGGGRAAETVPIREEGEGGGGDRRDGPGDGEEDEGSDGDRGEEWVDLGAACGVPGGEWRERGGQEATGGAEGGNNWTEDREEGGKEQLGDAEKDECESEMKEEVVVEEEFDEEYLQELEKDLSEEEKQSRREESLRLKETGNGQFKNGEHTEAEASYTAALGACPVCYKKERSILFSNRAAARLHLDQKEKAIADCTKAIELNPDYVRAILRRAELYEKTDKLDEALEDYKKVLEKDPGIPQAREACMRLPRQIEERNEKLKEEMMGKLKDLGNMFLRPFGLSTANFQVNQDPGSGSYSINFVQNPNNNNR